MNGLYLWHESSNSSLLTSDLLNSVMHLYVILGSTHDHSRSTMCPDFKIDVTRSDDYGVGKVAGKCETSYCRNRVKIGISKQRMRST